MTLLIQSLTVTLIVPAITLYTGGQWPPLQIYYDTTYTFFVEAIIGRHLIRILLTTPQSFHDSPPPAKSLSLRRGGTQWRSGGYRDIEASYSLYTGDRLPPLQICYDTTHTFFVGEIIGRPFNSYFTYHPSVVSRQLPSRGAIVVAATHHFA